jgi:CDGSH-type Zn-finger protein
MRQQPTIECKPNGPYLVKNLEDLQDRHGTPIATKPVIALCRCGGSGSKPFCDGTHQKIGFLDSKLADRAVDQRESYQAGRITIHDNRSICAHAGRCTDGLATVFKYQSDPWIDPAAGTVDKIIDTIHQCPSGALSYTLDGVAGSDPQRQPSITVTQDGPYAVAGGVQLLAQAWAQGASREHYTLCRCGGSKNKPFCDGMHGSIGFKDEGR